MEATRDRLLASAEAWVRTQGYAGFSYADLSTAVGIRKASIHHHFPTKEDLGVALVEVYASRMRENLEAIDRSAAPAAARLQAYADIYLRGLQDDKACLCAMLASDHALTPPRIQAGVTGFFRSSLDWLERVIRDGQADGTLGRRLDPAAAAAWFHAAVLGAMFTARTLGRLDHYRHVIDTAVRELGPAA